MPVVKNRLVKYLGPPAGGYPVPGEHLVYSESDEIDLDAVDLQGGILVRNLVVSIDPYQRGRMRPVEVKSYAPAFKPNQTVDNFGVGRVIRSDHAGYKPGDEVFCQLIGYEEYTVIPMNKLESPMTRIIDPSLGIPLPKWVGVAGMPGVTAFHGLYEIGQPKRGETIFVSAASGAVGQVVVQLAKREGLKVIGSCGSDDKVKFLREELGVDHAFNYKTCNNLEELKKFQPIDIYWDNVGGQTLDEFLIVANKFARIVACGMISQYNVSGEPIGVKNLMLIVAKSMKMEGFIVSDKVTWEKSSSRFYELVPKWLKSGEIKSKEDLTIGLENAIEALIGIFKGKNFGKAVIQIWDGKSA